MLAASGTEALESSPALADEIVRMLDLDTRTLVEIAQAQQAGDSATLLALLDRDRSAGHASRVLMALGRVGDARALPRVLEYMRADHRAQVQLDGWEAVGGFGTAALDALIREACEGEYAAKCGAVKGLAKAARPEDAGRLAPLVSDPNRAVRLRAASTLDRAGGDVAIRLLARLVHDSVPRNRRLAFRLLAATGGQTVADAVRRELPQIKQPLWRWWVRWRVGRMRGGRGSAAQCA